MTTPQRLCAIACFALVLFVSRSAAQELECTVSVNYEAISNTNKDLLSDFANDLQTYMNYRWGNEKLPEKIRCTINVFVQSVTGENKYQAQVFIGSQRKVYGTGESSAVIRLFDDSWEFTYIKNRPISHNVYQFSDLASFLDFYAYMVIGYDYDTYDPLGGTPFFQRASDIANMGQSSGQKGWQPSNSAYSRPQLIDELLNAKYAPVRQASFVYHFTGLDSVEVSKKQQNFQAQKNILTALQMIGTVKKNSDPRNLVIRTFFEAKYKEIAEIFTTYPDRGVYLFFSQIDPAHQKTYDEVRAKLE